jgi:hypothetical protein
MSTFGKVLLFFIVLAWAGFFVMTATVLKTHAKFRTQYETVKAELDQKTRWVYALEGNFPQADLVNPDSKYVNRNAPITVRPPQGQPITITVDDLEKRISEQRDGVMQALRALNDALADRGRWWPNVQPQVNAQGVATVTLAAPPSLTLQNQQNTVFVFEAVQPFDAPYTPGAPATLDIAGANPARRTRYVGEFKVTGVNGNAVTLEPAMPLTDAEKQQIQESAQFVQQNAQLGASWNLYETMPTDSYAPLDGATPDDVKALIDDSLEAMYLQHGQAPAAETPPERIFVLVQFNKDFADLSQAQKDELKSKAWMFDEAFPIKDIDDNPRLDASGNSLTVNVAEIIKKDARARFNLPTAEKLTSMTVDGAQLAQEVQPNPNLPQEGKLTREYWRPLYDYAQIFRRFYAQRPILLHRLAELNTDNQSMQESVNSLNAYFAKREALKGLLEKERDRLTQEKDLLVAYQEALQSRADLLASSITDLRKKNQELEQEFARLQLERKRQLEEGITGAPAADETEETPVEAGGERTARGE